MRRPRSLPKGHQFDSVYEGGSAFAGPFFVVRALSGGSGPAKWGFAVGKRSWPKSVDRNRIRRRFRAAAREVGGLVGRSYVVTARPSSERMDFASLTSELSRLVERSGVLLGDRSR